MSTQEFLHAADFPLALDIMDALLGRRLTSLPGFERDATGAQVDWEALATGWLSTSEKIVVALAHAVARAERYGGLLPCGTAIRTAVQRCTRD